MTELALKSRILGPDGQPFGPRSGDGNGHLDSQDGEAVLKWITSFATSVAGLAAPPISRARDPYQNSPWVYACAVMAAMNIAQAPFVVWRETDVAQKARVTKQVAAGRPWRGAFPSGRGRTALMRHFMMGPNRRNGMRSRGLEMDDSNPLMPLFAKPNPLMTGQQLWFLTTVWFAVRGECFWLLLDKTGAPTSWEKPETIDQIWPVAPDLFYEVLEGNTLVGWRFVVERGYSQGGQGRSIYVDHSEVVQFRRPDPNNPLRGASPLTSAAGAIYSDQVAQRSNTQTQKTGGPAGVLVHDGPKQPFKNRAEEDEFRQSWDQRHGQSDNERRIALLTGGWKYIPVGLAPKDMHTLETRKWNREEILAVMMTPASILSVGDKMTYATQLGQDRNFWDKNLLPTMQVYEQEIDSTILQTETDDVVGGFDTSHVESLRAGIGDKLSQINTLTGPNIHMPPKYATQVVGLDFPGYEGDDIALVAATVVPFDTILHPPPAPPVGVGPPGQGATPSSGGPAPGNPSSTAPNASPTEPEPSGALGDSKSAKSPIDISRDPGYNNLAHPKVTTSKVNSTWRALISRVQRPNELKFKRAWRDFVARQRRRHLARFDAATRVLPWGHALLRTQVDTSQLGVDLERMIADALGEFTPLYQSELGDVTSATNDELGLDVAEDEPDLVSLVSERAGLMASETSQTLVDGLGEAIQEGMTEGEAVDAIRARLTTVWDRAASSGRSVSVARTESAGFMNDAREVMFAASGFEQREWITAGDEHVRESHAIFGEKGPQPVGTNYMKFIGGQGRLEYPGDTEGPAGEVINCRCVHVPV